jgi:hypothetical protein
MKVAPVFVELERRGHEAVLVHTGQHCDTSMSQAFFDDLSMREPDHYLGVGGGSHAVQTARVMVTALARRSSRRLRSRAGGSVIVVPKVGMVARPSG